MPHKRKTLFSYLLPICVVIGITGLLRYGGDIFATSDAANAATAYSDAIRGPNPATDADGPTDAMFNMRLIFSLVQDAITIFMRPLITIAGQAMGNEFVFGEVFGLEQPLFGFWTIMKNIANYIIGFLFFGSILLSFIGIQKDYLAPKRLIPRMFIAIVVVHSSFFLIRALLDIANVATYAVGGLPLHVLGTLEPDSQPTVFNQWICPMNLYISRQGTNTNADDIQTIRYFTHHNNSSRDGGEHYVQCPFFGDDIPLSIIEAVGNRDIRVINVNKREADVAAAQASVLPKIYYDEEAGYEFSQNICFVSGDEFYYYRNIDEVVEDENKGNIRYIVAKRYVTDAGPAEGGRREPIDEVYVDLQSPLTEGSEDFTIRRSTSCTRLSDAIATAKGLSGPLFAMYNGLMDSSAVVINKVSTSLKDQIFMSMISAFVLIALFVPLAVLAVVMVIRIGYLWMIIGFAPVLAVFFVLGINLPGDIGKRSKLSLSSILSLIFLPAVVTFTMSIGIVFMSAISSRTITTARGLNHIVSLDENGCINDFGTICVGANLGQAGNELMHLFAYLIVNFFGIAILWFVVFAALKTSTLTEGVVTGLQNFAEGMLAAAPIVPVPGVGRVGMSGLTQGVEQGLKNAPQAAYSTQSTAVSEAIGNLIGTGRKTPPVSGEEVAPPPAAKTMPITAATDLHDPDDMKNFIQYMNDTHSTGIDERATPEEIVSNPATMAIVTQQYPGLDMHEVLEDQIPDIYGEEKRVLVYDDGDRIIYKSTEDDRLIFSVKDDRITGFAHADNFSKLRERNIPADTLQPLGYTVTDNTITHDGTTYSRSEEGNSRTTQNE